MRTFEWVQGTLIDRDDAEELPAGAYTTLRTYGGTRVMRLPDHVRRLSESVRLQGREGPLDAESVRASIAEALVRTGHRESRLRLTWSPPHLLVSVEAFAPPAEALYRDGVRCVTVPVRRANPHSKDTRFIETAGAAYATLPAGVHEGLMVAEDGTILEGLSSNFFAVRGDALYTEDERVLPGLTRSLVLEVSPLPHAPRGLRVGELGTADECFVTSASRGVLPVVAVDDVAIGAGAPGPQTATIREAFEAAIAREAVDVRG
jgi:branched-subunit amino acid aminotransferase/4-amino-4-deoxychorismate lyase